jgi:hypothetical protein
MMVCGRAEQEPRSAESFKQMKKLDSSNHRQSLEIRRNIHQDCQQAIEEWLKSLMTGGDYFMKNCDKQIRMCSGENWNVHWNGSIVWLVQPNSKVSFSRKK